MKNNIDCIEPVEYYKRQLSTAYMAQIKRNCLTEQSVKGFLKPEFH